MQTKKCTKEEQVGAEQTLGGRALIAKILQEEVDPSCEPFSAKNKIIITNGCMAGTGVSSSGRLSVGGKSPLTGGAKESNAGGTLGDTLAKLDLRAIIIEDRNPNETEKLIMVIDSEGNIKFDQAEAILGKGNFESAEALFAQYGKDNALLILGPAAEQRLYSAAIAVTDLYNRPSRMAARGGLAAVLADKGIKAIVVSKKGKKQLPGMNEEAFKAARKNFNDTVRDSDRVKVLREYGTSSTYMPMHILGAVPTRNFREGVFEKGEEICGEALHDLIDERGGVGCNSEACMAGCQVKCSNVFPDAAGKEIVAPLEYETLVLMGSNLGIGDLDQIGQFNWLANDLGVDTIELGGTLGVMAEAGLVNFGDYAGFEKIIKGIYEKTMEGRIAGMGAYRAAELLGVRRAPVVKKQTMSAYDPRAIKGTGVTYATSPMGADHTAGLTIFFPGDHTDKTDEVMFSQKAQIQRAGYDCIGLCCFLTSAFGMNPAAVTDVIAKLYNIDFTPDSWNELAKATLRKEVEFNRAAGLGKETDTIPEFFKTEKLIPSGAIWDIEDSEMDVDLLFA